MKMVPVDACSVPGHPIGEHECSGESTCGCRLDFDLIEGKRTLILTICPAEDQMNLHVVGPGPGHKI